MPLVLVIGTYGFKTVVTVSCVQFAIVFVDFWFQLARWIDSTIMIRDLGLHQPGEIKKLGFILPSPASTPQEQRVALHPDHTLQTLTLI